MSQHNEPVVRGTPVQLKRSSTPDTSDKENEAFEDAVDTGSIRSLTQRKSSGSRRLTNERRESDIDHPTPDRTSEEDKSDKEVHRKPSPHQISKTADTELDNVNLDESTIATTKGKSRNYKPAIPAIPNDRETAETSSADKEPPKTITLSSLTNALPSMPWSPSTSEASPKIPGPISTSPSLPPPGPTRKLTNALSWLSRNPSKDQAATSPPATASPRRNTASSVATLTSNPEMMLSKLEEGKEIETGGNGSKNMLRDRFKALRIREEAGVILPKPDNDGTTSGKIGAVGLGVQSPTGAVADDKDAFNAGIPPPSPVPASPNLSLAPGTVSGVSAGPSALTDVPVDWDLWQSVVYEGPAAVARTSPEELNKAIASGIPNAIRGVIWQVLAQSKNDHLEVMYRELVARGTDKELKRDSNGTSASTASNGNLSIQKEPASSASSVHSDHSAANGSSTPPAEKEAETAQRANAAMNAEQKQRQKEDTARLQKLEKTIKRDLGARTSFSKYAAAQGLQEGLFGVCKAYALFDEGVGYAQGMNFLIMPLLFNMSEDEAFCLLVRLMNQYQLRDLFVQDMPGLHMHLYQFERLLEDLEPALYCHLHRRGISPHLYATQWFLTLFAYRFPLQLVLRIYDLIFSEGLSAIIKFGIVLMQKNAAALLAMSDMAQLSTFLKDRLFDVYIDASPSSNSILESGFFGSSSSSADKEVYRADQLVRDACEVKITPDLLKQYTAEWEEKTRAEKEREAEIQDLRTANSGLTVKVRRLEERIEAVDREQAVLATELVHTKVENEELGDQNESLKGQVRELKVVIEKQPAEIEEAWKLERDDLMKRNGRVHEENERLEKELAELEEELVQTKMNFAEINSQHETLTRKWTDLKRQFA